MSDYRNLVRSLNDLDAAEAAALVGAHREFDADHGAAVAEVARASRSVREADARVEAAGRTVDAVDERSAALWNEMHALLGRRPEALPEPALEITVQSTATARLDHAATMIARVATGEPIAPVPRAVIPLLPPGGALATLAIVLPIRGILALAGGRAPTLGLIAEILLFCAPFAGVPVLIAGVRHRYGARPDIGAVGLTALGGMIATCAAALIFR
jgi:hypothetical protein